MKKQTVTLELELETKNTFRFKETGDKPPVLRTIYIQKDAWGNPAPKERAEIKVTIEAV